jgi:phosphotransferase system  glucose/maltose/N-acetylglucosamine-specific IIC component
MPLKKRKSTFWSTGNVVLLTIILALILIAWFYLPIWMYLATGLENKDQDIGKLGDMYGLLNTLFTGLSIVALIVTILNQQKEITDNQRMARFERFENRFFKYIDLRNDLFKELYNSFENFEKDFIKANLKQTMTLPEYQKVYQQHIEKAEVIKNFGNYLAMFEIMLKSIDTKQLKATREKYYTLLAAQLHVNEKRFFLYHYNFSADRPTRWKEVTPYLFAGLTKDHIDQQFRTLELEVFN